MPNSHLEERNRAMSTPQRLTKPLLVPQYVTGTINFYTPQTQPPAAVEAGHALLNPNFTVDLQSKLSSVGISNSTPRPNCCTVLGTDLYVTTNGSSPALIKLSSYLQDGNAAPATLIATNPEGYLGVAFDRNYPNPNLYVIAANGNSILRYPATAAGFGSSTNINDTASGDGYSVFANMAFDAAGNLWAVDYQNNRLVVFEEGSLASATPVWHALLNPSPTLVLNDPAYDSNPLPMNLFVGPEGLDFDSFGTSANLWVGNNNDGNSGIAANAYTSLVMISPALQTILLNTPAPGTSGSLSTTGSGKINLGTNCFIYPVPFYTVGGGSPTPQFGGLQIDKAASRLYVNDEVAGMIRAYDILGGTVSIANDGTNTDSLLATTVTTDPGNGGIALLQLGPYVQDYTGDSGLEPDSNDPDPLWESVNIVATPFDLGNRASLPVPGTDTAVGVGEDGSDTILGTGSNTRYIYVQVNNFGPTPTTGIEQLNLYWAKGSSAIGWPAPWDGSVPNPTHSTAFPTLGAAIALGVDIPQIAPSTPSKTSSVIVGPVPWSNVPDPTQFDPQDGHFCLLARIVTPNANYVENTGETSQDSSLQAFAGMSFPEESGSNANLTDNVQNNARIAWRNIHIITPAQEMQLISAGEGSPTSYFVLPPVVSLTNYGAIPLHVRIGFELLDTQRRPMREPLGELLISATGKSLQVLERSSLERLPQHPSRRHHGRAGLPHIGSGIDNIRIEPGETLAFHVEYAAPPGAHHYALRANAYAKGPGGERLIGGQTFVYGHVEGFGTKPRHPVR
jgi:hypothetical protein